MGNGSGGQDGGRRPLEDEGSAAEVLKEVREKRVTTRQETNETVETEDIKHLGDISDEVSFRYLLVDGTQSIQCTHALCSHNMVQVYLHPH